MAIETTIITSAAGLASSDRELELSIVMPCLNEAETLATCINKAQQSLREHKVDAEIIVADNGSTDGSQEIARTLGARVVSITAKGYGNALMGGIIASHGKYIIMGDADDSYDFSKLGPFIEKLRAVCAAVIGDYDLGLDIVLAQGLLSFFDASGECFGLIQAGHHDR